MQPTIDRKIIIRITLTLVAIVIFVLVIQYIADYLSTGRINVTTNTKESSLTLVKKGDTKSQKFKGGRLDTRVKPGDYTVTASLGDAESRYSVKVEARKSYTAQLELSSPKIIQEFANYQATGIVAQGNRIAFLNIPFQSIYSVEGVGSEAVPIIDDYEISRVNWVNYDSGYFRDSFKNTYQFTSNGQVAIFTLRAAANTPAGNIVAQGGTVSIDDMAVNSLGDRLMRLGSDYYFQAANETTAQLAPIDNRSENSDVALANNGIAALFSQPNIAIAEDETSQNYTPPNQEPLRITLYDTRQRKNLSTIVDTSSTTVDGSAWSPDGKFLAYISDQAVHILDAQSGKITIAYAQPEAESSSLQWLSPTQLSYVQNGNVWLFAIDNNVARKVARLNATDLVLTSSYFDAATQTITYATYTRSNGIVGKIYQLNTELR